MRKLFSWVALVVTLSVQGLSAQSGTLMPAVKFTGWDANGDPLSGGKLCSYVAGTSTPLATYSDVDLAIGHVNTNPVILNSSGLPTSGAVYLTPGASYKFILKDAGSDATCATGSTIWSQDNVSSIPSSAANLDITGTAGETIAANKVVYLSDGSGSKVAGQWYVADAANGYSSSNAVSVGIAPAAITTGTTGTIRIAGQAPGVSLTPGVTYYIGTSGALTATAPTNRRQMGIADTVSTLVVERQPTAISKDGTVAGPLKSYAEMAQVVAISAGTLAVDISLGNHVIVALGANITTITVTNIPALANTVVPLVVYFVPDGTPRTVVSTINGSSVHWPGGVAPTITGTAGKIDRIVYTDIIYAGFAQPFWTGEVIGQSE